VDASEEEIKASAQNDAKIKEWIKGKTIAKVVFVPRKLVNLVIK